MKKKIKIAICGINPYSGNRGVGALAISTFYLLNQIAKDKDFQLELTAINSNYGKYSIEVGNETLVITNILSVSILGLKKIIKLFLDPKLLNSFLKYFSFDYILCMGEGDSFSDIYGEQRFTAINDQHKMARLLRKKYLLLPQTIGPFNNLHIQEKANKSIDKAHVVFARDLQSLKYVFQYTNQKNIFESIDVAFFMPFKREIFSEDYIHVGLNISSLLWNGGYTQNNQFNLKIDYKELTYRIIDYFIAKQNVKIHIVPHVVLPNPNIENDYEVSLNLVKEYKTDRIIIAPFFLNPIVAKNYIAGLSFFAGARMHSTIAAFSSGVPVFPLGYSRKFTGLFKDTLKYSIMGDLINDDMKTITENLIKAFNEREKLKKIIQYKLNTIVKEKENTFRDTLAKTFFN